ncbi:MAG: glycine betaine ABC transporter substrate-binding protein [Mycobacteriales bacterium]
MRSRTPVLSAVLGVLLTATACGGGDPATPGDGPLSDATITVGSKDFDEQLILGHISKLALEDAGATVVDQINLGGTDASRGALVSGKVDHYWEYNGTAWISFFKETEPIPDRIEQYEVVRDRDLAENELVWLEPANFNNTYGLAFRSEAAAELGSPETISDLASVEAGALSLCVESEFSTRDDGLPGLEKTYGFEFPDKQVTVLDTGIVYTSTDKGQPCNFGEIFTTDGRIGALDLTVLEDDKAFFPLYNASPVFTKEVMDSHGEELTELYGPITEALTQDVMTDLNKRVSADGERPEQVAKSWLEDNDLIG